ncbi:MAG: alpha/beta hydrolase [Lachnospiraceae bacterium]|nr:alpha/beta hydrolase [Lachnospiraceae bacterium]
MKNKKKTLLEYLLGIGFILSLLHLCNKLIFFFATYKEKLYNQNGHYYSHKSGKIYYTKSGEGSPLLLIHDLHCSSSSYEWNEVVKDFSKKYSVYTIDLLGCGRSDKPNITYTSYLYVQLITDFIKEIIGEPAYCIATADSSPLLIMSAHMHPETCTKITLINPTYFDDAKCFPSRFDKFVKDICNTPIVGSFIYNLSTLRGSILKDFHIEYFFSTNSKIKKYTNYYYEAAHLSGNSGKYLFASKQGHYLGCNVNAAFSCINMPITIIFGDSMAYVTDMWDYAISLNPNTKIHTIPNTALFPHLERPDLFIKYIK